MIIYEGCFDKTTLLDIGGHFYSKKLHQTCKLNCGLDIISSKLLNLHTFAAERFKIENSSVNQIHINSLKTASFKNTHIGNIHTLQYDGEVSKSRFIMENVTVNRLRYILLYAPIDASVLRINEVSLRCREQ